MSDRKFHRFLVPAIAGMVVLFTACQQNDPPPVPFNAVEVEDAISIRMASQETAWNDGDIEGFMKAYLKSDSLVFIGKSGLNYGWDTTLANYRRSYPDRDAMGILTFENLIVNPIEPDAAFVVGKWVLHRSADTLSGHYSLLWQRISGEWFIIADHSS